MTREEEREQAARLYSPNNAHHTADTFEYGAEWADKTMLVKACEWLKENMSNYIIEHPFFPAGSSVTVEEDKMVEDFRKAMKGE